MTDPIDTWLAHCPDPAQDPLPGMREAGLLEPVPDYATIARIKAALVERTGLLGVGSVWGGRQLVFRHFVRGFGTEAQQAAWRGRALAVAISEPKVGAHPKLLTTRADSDGDGFRITGQKAWVSNGPSADAIIVFAITAEEDGRKRYSAFIVPRDTAGLGISEMPGFHALAAVPALPVDVGGLPGPGHGDARADGLGLRTHGAAVPRHRGRRRHLRHPGRAAPRDRPVRRGHTDGHRTGSGAGRRRGADRGVRGRRRGGGRLTGRRTVPRRRRDLVGLRVLATRHHRIGCGRRPKRQGWRPTKNCWR